MFKAKKTFDNEKRDPAVRKTFIGGRGWCEKFKTRHGFSLRRITTTPQKDPSFPAD